MRSIVAFYEVDREYGGPEEGGWHYDTGRFVRAIGFYLTDEAAITAVRRANRLLERLQRHRRSVDSVLYEGGRYRAFSFTGLPPARFPAERPTTSDPAQGGPDHERVHPCTVFTISHRPRRPTMRALMQARSARAISL